MQDITAWLQFGSNVILVFVTIVYVYIMKKILDTSTQQANLSYNPVVGIEIRSVSVGEVFGPNRRELIVNLSLVNIGNAPAIEITCDGEIVLEYSEIENERNIPARVKPSMIPFIRVNDEVAGDIEPSLCFGNRCVSHVLDDMRESERLNLHRIATDPTRKPYTSSRLRVIVCYRNNLNQWFRSFYECYLYLESIPSDDQHAEFRISGIARPLFLSEPISEKEISKDLASRNAKRDLSGW